MEVGTVAFFPLAGSHISRLANLKNNNNKILKKQGKENKEKEEGASHSRPSDSRKVA